MTTTCSSKTSNHIRQLFNEYDSINGFFEEEHAMLDKKIEEAINGQINAELTGGA